MTDAALICVLSTTQEERLSRVLGHIEKMLAKALIRYMEDKGFPLVVRDYISVV
jgi:hypothetical protein